jgi:RNA-binding protein
VEQAERTISDQGFLKQLRGIAHHLEPIISVGEKGITDGVAAEVERALTDHELIKVRINGFDREARRDICEALCVRTEAAQVQRIGKVIVMYRENPKAKPALSNVARFS